MPWGVDDVDLVITMIDRCLLGSDGDAALVLLIAGVHNQLLAHLGLVVTERLGLLQQPIDQRRLTMVDVGDDCDVADVLRIFHKNKAVIKPALL